MTDLVEQLHAYRVWNRRAQRYDAVPVVCEAADMIERLREREAELQAQWGFAESISALEIERLRALVLDGCQVFEHYDLPEHAYHYRRELDRSADRPRDDGTAVAVGGEPGASAGKSE